jgi:hypothetical protein
VEENKVPECCCTIAVQYSFWSLQLFALLAFCRFCFIALEVFLINEETRIIVGVNGGIFDAYAEKSGG